MKEKLTWVMLPSAFLMAVGALACSFPDAFKDEGGYAGYGGRNAFVVFIYRVFLYLFWGKPMGIIFIILSVGGIIYFIKEIFKKEEVIPLDVEIRQKITTTALSEAFKLGKRQIKKSSKNNNN